MLTFPGPIIIKKSCLNADPTLPRRNPRQKKPLLVSPDFLIFYCEAEDPNTMLQLHGRDVRAKWTVIELVLVLSFTIRIGLDRGFWQTR